VAAAPRTGTSSGSSWLVAGHGSVGSFVAARLVTDGGNVFVFDPDPRVPVVHGRRIDHPRDGQFDYVISCVSPDAAEEVAALVGDSLDPTGIFFDWNTIAPGVKQRIGGIVGATVIDVALLDSLDADVDRPNLAVSGKGADEAARLLEAFGFRAAVAGTVVGQAATLKYLRSIFMKGLEAVVLEYASLASEVDGEPIVRASLRSDLGEPFVRFMDLLLTTNRIHAERRSRELAGALAVFADGVKPRVSLAAVQVLHEAAEAWADDTAPPVDADSRTLANHLHGVLWREPAST
jgi:hypothetical protein